MLFSPLFHRWKVEVEEGNILPKVIEPVSGGTEICIRTVQKKSLCFSYFQSYMVPVSLTPGPVLLVFGLSIQGIEETLNTGIT